MRRFISALLVAASGMLAVACARGSAPSAAPEFTHPRVEAIARDRAAAGLVVVGVHTPELRDERSPENVRAAVARLGIRYPVMLDADYSYWGALHNQYWPAFYLIGRDGLLHGSAIGELHVGEGSARKVEAAIDQLLKAPVQ